MTQKLSSPLEQQIVGPHIRHPNPHPQYALKGTDTITEAEVETLIQAFWDSHTSTGMSMPSDAVPAAETVAATGAPGSAPQYSRADHIHPMPGLATESESGFMSNTDKGKLDAILFPMVISPLAGALLDIDTGELVWDVETYEQVLS